VSDSPSRSRILLAYLSVFIVWGSTYLAIRIGVHDLPPAFLAGVRFLVSGFLMLTYARFTNRHIPSSSRDIRILSIVGILLLVGGNGLVVWAEQWVHSGLAALIVATVPLFMSSVDSLVPGGNKLSRMGWIGITIGFGGVALLVSPSLGYGEGERIYPLGIAGLVCAAFLWSLGSVYSNRRKVAGDIFAVTGIEMLAGGAVLMGIAIVSGELGRVQFTTNGTLALIYLILFGSIVGFTSYAYLLRHVPAAKASTYAYVNPGVAVFLGFLILDEPITLQTILAMVVILAGVALVQMARMKREPNDR